MTGSLRAWIALTLALAAGFAPAADVLPEKNWATKAPFEVGMDATQLKVFSDFVGGRGCVVRHGYMVYTWGDPAALAMVYSAAKPWISHFLFKAIEEGRIPSLDQKVSVWEPRLNSLNAALGYKDRDITWRHMASQISCYSVKDRPGTAFNYNDYQMALLFDTLMYKVFGATTENVDATVLHARLTGPLQCQDTPSFIGNDLGHAGLIHVSPRDFARFGLLYLRGGNWNGRQLISAEHVKMAVSSPLPSSLPDSAEELAEMIHGQRTIGRVARPQKQGNHGGSYSWLWWVNGVDREGKRRWPDAPLDTYAALGAQGNAMVTIPSLDLVASWSSPAANGIAAQNEALKRLSQSAQTAGPRGPIGPDVPLSEAEQKQFAKRITVEGRTAAAVQTACERAAKDGLHVVLLPMSEYVFDKEVRVPGGVTLLGEGARTVIRTKDKTTHLFSVDGDKVRFTRLRLHGAETTVSLNNDTYGISAGGKKNVRIDHCELLGFSYAINFADEATAQVDHCSIHDNLREGLGYGVAIYSGAYVLVTDNEFSQNRHSLASNGALDWSSGKRLGKYVHKPGVRKSHWEFIHNRVGSSDKTTHELCAVDTHPGMDGTFVVEGNIFEDLRHGIGIRDGAGIIRGNRFRNLRSVMTWRPVTAISIGYGTHNNIPVEGCMPHDVQVSSNTFEAASGRAFTDAIVTERAEVPNIAKYRLGKAENVTVEGRLIPETKVARPAPPIPRLREMGADGVLPEPETQ